MSVRGRTIRSLRKRAGLLQVELAKMSGVNRSRLSLIENEWLKPHRHELAALSLVLGFKIPLVPLGKRLERWLRNQA
jgi:transcriptional regulator with XRE-family HTH domain